MKRLALLLPLLALAAAPARAEDPATNAPSDNIRIIVTEQAFAGERLTFQIEAWHCIDSTNGTVVSLFPWLAEDGCGDGSTAFTMPQRSVVFKAISNRADRVRLLHAPPVRVRTGDRADLFAPGFDLAASVVENQPGIGLALLRDASSARESGTFPTPGAQSDFMSYSDVTRCFVAPSAGEGSPLAFLFLAVSGPLAEDAERFPLRHADAGEAAEQIERMAEEDGRGDGFALRVEERTNSLLFSGSDSDREFVRDCVKKLDVPRTQVVVHCFDVVVKNGMEDLFGREWVARNLRATFLRDGTSTNAWFSSVRVKLDDVAKATLRTTNARFLSSSRCVTRSGRALFLEVADGKDWERKCVRLAATPTIQTNGTVQMEFLVESLLRDGIVGTNSVAGCETVVPGDAIVVGGLGADGGELLAFFFPEIVVPEDRADFAESESNAESAESATPAPHADSAKSAKEPAP